ncbi:MAG: DUF4340 domain-containing protein [Lentisphaerae bacterium]|nr:DUF4340 domain-containing protein [Lentisphaerota bacterium]
MKKAKLFGLVLAAVVLGLLASWTGRSRQPQKLDQLGKPVLPGLSINAIGRIEIAQPSTTVTLANTDDGWVVSSLYNYPADVAKIRENLLALRNLTVGAIQRGARIDSTNAILVDLQDASGKSLASIRLGEVRNTTNPNYGWDMPDGRSVAANASDTVFLVKDSLTALESEAKTWVNTEVLSVQASDIATVVLSGPDGAATLDRSSGALTLNGLAEGESIDPSRVSGVESALTHLRFVDLADPALSDAQTGMATGHTFTVTTTDGTIYAARIGAAAPDRSDRYLRLAVSAQPVSTNAAERVSVTQQADELNRLVSPWLFLISSWNADTMTRSRSSFIQVPTPPVSTDTPSEPAPEASAAES